MNTFKNIPLDPPIETLNDQVPSQASNTKPIPEILAAIRLKNIDKKKSKWQTLTNKQLSLQSHLATLG